MNYQKLIRKEKALELVEFCKRLEKISQLNALNAQVNVVNQAQKENRVLEMEIAAFKKESLSINDFYSELNNSLKMEFIADTHRQQSEAMNQLTAEIKKLEMYKKNINDLSGQHSVIERKLNECQIDLRKEVNSKIQKDCM